MAARKISCLTLFDETERLRAAAANPISDFLKYPEEVIYTLSNGRPFYDEMVK